MPETRFTLSRTYFHGSKGVRAIEVLLCIELSPGIIGFMALLCHTSLQVYLDYLWFTCKQQENQ